MIDRLTLLDWLLPYCQPARVALFYPKGDQGLSPGWLKRAPDVERAVQAFRDGTLGDQVFQSATQTGSPYTIERAERLGVVPHRDGFVTAFCVDLDDHAGDGGTVRCFERICLFFGATPVVFTSRGGRGLHLLFQLERPLPVAEFVAWVKAWGFNRSGQIEVFPKSAKLSQFWLPNEPNEAGGDRYKSGDFAGCVVCSLPIPPPVKLSNTTLNFLRGLVLPGDRNSALNMAAHELGRRGVAADEAWRLCKAGAQLCGLYDEEPDKTETTFASGYQAGSSAGLLAVESNLPVVLLPGGNVRISDAAAWLGQLLAKGDRFYFWGGVLVTIERRRGVLQFNTIRPAVLTSEFERVARLMKSKLTAEGVEEIPSICSEQQAKVITSAEAFIQALPAIQLLAPCPVVTVRDGKLLVVNGYDRESGILAEGPAVSEVPVQEACRRILEMLADFEFATPPDLSRAVASIITPALVFGDLLEARAPVDLGEADQSQAGKGYRNKLTATIYRQSVNTVTQKKGGVGSLEETFNSRLVRGANFISFDNVRGKIDSPAIESFLTEDTYSARVPYEPSVEIDPRRVIVQMTSNKAELTDDFANRTSCVRILKRDPNREYRRYAEGDILDHVRANQPLYLGAVFAIVRAWYDAGRPQTNESRHDFRRWARTLDWIVQNLFGLPPLMDGHLETKDRMTNPSLTWLRDVALAVRQEGQLDLALKANHILDIVAEQPDIELPGLGAGDDLTHQGTRTKVLQALGRRLAMCFKQREEVRLDDLVVRREVDYDKTNRRENKTYLFFAAPMASTLHGRTTGAPIGAGDSPLPTKSLAAPLCAYQRSHRALKPSSPMSADAKPLSKEGLGHAFGNGAPNAPEDHVATESFDTEASGRDGAGEPTNYSEATGALGALGGTAGQPETEGPGVQ